MLSDKINSLPISQTVAMTAKAHDLKNQGIDVITLSAGEPDFDIPCLLYTSPSPRDY